MSKSPVYIIGHTNPDTDSVCSALAYSELLKKRNPSWNIIAASAGSINRQTQFILQEFGYPHPKIITDIAPRAYHLLQDQLITIKSSEPLARAIELFHLYRFSVLPVINDDKDHKCLGVLSLSSTLSYFLRPRQASELRKVSTSLNALAQTLKGEVLVAGKDPTDVVDRFISTVSSSVEAFRVETADHTPEDWEHGLFLVGALPDVHSYLIEKGAGVLVLTAGRPAEHILKAAEKRGVTIVSTSLDAGTATLLARQSTPVGQLQKFDPLELVGKNRRVSEIRAKFEAPANSELKGVAVVDRDGQCLGVCTRKDLMRRDLIRVVLMDHNEIKQSVSGVRGFGVRVIEIVDHHRLAPEPSPDPITITARPVGSTCTVVADLYRFHGFVPTPAVAGLLLAGLLSDTVILRSPTTTQHDRDTANYLSQVSGYSIYDLGTRMLAAGSDIRQFSSIEAMIRSDYKKFQLPGDEFKFAIGQVEVMALGEFDAVRDQVLTTMEQVLEHDELNVACLLVTDIVRGNSLLVVSGHPAFSEVIGYDLYDPKIKGVYFCRGVLSRKKQMLPHLMSVLPLLS